MNGSSALSAVGVIGGMTGDRCRLELAAFMARFDGLRGIVGDSGDRMGELGRLWKVSMVGGIGVLDGRGPMSIGSTGNGLG